MQARMGSKRLPGKSLLPLAGEPLVFRILQRILRCSTLDEVILALPNLSTDEVLASQAKRLNVPVVYGDELNVADRYEKAILQHRLDVVVRIPADNYLTEAWAVDMMVNEHKKFRTGFSTNIMQILDSGFPDGIGCEVFEGQEFLLRHGLSCTSDVDEHVHQHYYNYLPSEEFKIRTGLVRTVECPLEFAYPLLKFDVNTWQDYRKAERIYDSLSGSVEKFGLAEVLKLPFLDLTN